MEVGSCSHGVPYHANCIDCARPSVDLAAIPVVILAGGRGARFDHESHVRPKPMICVLGRPILAHIIDSLALQGFQEFIVAAGYLGEQISAYFASVGRRYVSANQYDLYRINPCGDRGLAEVRVSVVDTGIDSHTGQRLANVAPHIAERDFVLTYGDGLADVDMGHLIEVHGHMQSFLAPIVTVTAVNPPGRFGVIEMESGTGYPYYRQAASFAEKPRSDQWINGGFMFAENSFLSEYICDGEELESGALTAVARDGGLFAYLHRGYWRCMDTRRDLEQIEADAREQGGLPWLRTSTDRGRMTP